MSDWLSDLGSRWREAVREIKEQIQGPGPNMILNREPLFVRCDRSRAAADVILNPGAQRSLAPAGTRASAPEFSEIFVLLAEAEDEDRRSGPFLPQPKPRASSWQAKRSET